MATTFSEIGDLRVDPVIDGSYRLQPTELYAGSSDSEWAPHQDLLDADGLIGVATGGFLIRGHGRTTLVDLGVGPAATDPGGVDSGQFIQALAALGVAPDDVTDVVLTHLHYDHVGWAAPGGRPTFSQATYRCHQADWDHFMINQPGIERELVVGATDQFQTWSTDGTLLPGIDTRLAPGHTPGSSLIVLSSGGARAILLGDAVHCAIELVDDEWDGIYDVDPALARRTRLALIEELERDGTPAAAAHFPGLQFGRLLPGEVQRRWTV